MNKVLGEKTAKVLIYLLSVLALVAFLFFYMSAQKYHAATAEPESAPESEPVALPAEVVPEAGLAPRQAKLPLLQAARSTLLQVTAEIAAKQLEARPAPLVQPVIGLEMEAAGIPAGSGILAVNKQPDIAALAAELERVAALGFEVSMDDLRYEGLFNTTAYCGETYPHICGGNGVTASGTVPTPGLTAASDWEMYPPGTWLYIEGVGIRRVEDSGSAIKGYKLDINVQGHDEALRWPGFGWHDAWVLQWPEAK